jgi:hypothetical protein
MKTSSPARWVVLSTLAAGLLLACRGGGGPGAQPTPAATPNGSATGAAPAASPSHVTRISVGLTNPNTGETVDREVEFDQGAGAGDDPTKEGNRGKTLVEAGVDGAVVFPMDEDGGLHPAIGLGEVRCGRQYLVSRSVTAPTHVAGCAPPAAMAAQFDGVTKEALARAVEVVKECWKTPSCQARIAFQGSRRSCYQSPDGTWYLFTCYEVRVTCLTL